MTLRQKFVDGHFAKLRASKPAKTGDAVVIEGYASTFGNVDSYGDIVKKGAFARTLAARDWPVTMFSNHFVGSIGKWTELVEDDFGLRVRGELTPGHSVASDVAASLAHGAVTGLSIGFRVPDGGATGRMEGGGFILTNLDLVEISVVDLPANTAAQVSDVRDFREELFERDVLACTTLSEIERAVCRHTGMARRDARELSEAMKRTVASELKATAANLNEKVLRADSRQAMEALKEIEDMLRRPQ